MFDEGSQHTSQRIGRRQFVGGLTSLAAASAFSLSVSDAAAAQVTAGDDSPTQTVTSPDGTVAVTVDVTDGVPSYRIAHGGTTVIENSTLGFEFENQPAFRDGVTVTGTERSTVDETWTPVWDRYDEIREHYAELRLGLRESGGSGRALTLAVRAFDDGVGFRFVFPEDSGFGEFTISAERTQFAFADDSTAWWIQSDFNSYEYAYEETPLSEIGSQSPTGGAHTPITMKTAEDRYVSVHEANLVDYASMAVRPVSNGSTTFESNLAPLPDGTKVTASAPHRTPWRTVQLGERPGDLVESNLVVNLNEPRDPEAFPQGTDWIEPQKFIGIWWLMITGRADWEYTGPETGNHGAQTGRMKQYMEFASEHEIPSVLVEGWNEGWDSYPGDGSTMDFDDPYPDFDWQEVVDFGRELDPSVEMTAHNETAGNVSNYESQLDDDPNPFADYDEKGIRSIKTGYVADSGVSIDGTTYNHHCQALVNHHHLVYREAAKHRQMLEVHEPIKPTGERRTYPNVMTREGVLGQEYDSFGYIDPSHHVTFPFTRMLGGPVEFTPGIFDMDSGSGGIETTRAKQLAMYPTYFSGLHMAADLPSSYLADRPATLETDAVAQAEFGEIEGFPTGARWANAQGERYVRVDPNNAGTGASVSWTIENVESAGEYELHLRYASDAEDNAVPADTDRTATVTVDGSARTHLTFPPTEYWDEWTAISTTISLAAGENTISVSLADGDSGGFNLDSIAVTETGESMPAPETAPIRGPTVEEFQFIEDVPAAGWDDTRVLDAAIGEYTVTARQKDEEWYVGAMTDENGRALDVPLDFLAPGKRKGHRVNGEKDERGGRGRGNGNGRGKGHEKSKGRGHDDHRGKGKGHGKASGNGHEKHDEEDERGDQKVPNGPKYVAEIYSDGIDAAYDANLADVRVDEAIVTPRTTLLASMVETGGTAVRFRRATDGEVGELPRYERPTQEVDVAIADEVFVQETFITATGSNASDFIGGTTVEIAVDGEVASSANVRFPPNTTDASYTFSSTIDEPGTYDVRVRTTDGTTLAAETVTIKPPATVADISDPSGDDDGPGGYTYPTADAFRSGAFDLQSFVVEQTPSIYEFTFEVENLYNAFGSSRGFSPQMFVLWVRDPAKSGGSTSSLDDLGATVEFEQPWHYRLEISGFTKSIVDATGAPVTNADDNTVSLNESVDMSAGTITLTLDRDAFDGVDTADLEVIAMVQSEDRGTLRPVAEQKGAYVFGGAKSGAADVAPRIVDLITPDGVSQPAALSYSAGQRATLPFRSL
ncbi:glycoside hydrolase family 97 catalytic domain-containing protein [Halococcus saccharolyticus]|nr:glycoside hydrolase family 97 catalytic domain-containing protein [Halococcus saccharolyticus]